ncbi:hypothetical protein RUND412_001244 [Rhizina undulata]
MSERPSYWPPANTVDPQNLQPAIYGPIVAFSIIAIITVILRIYTRAVIVKKIGADDWVIIAATFFLIAFTICNVLVVKFEHLGFHIWDIVSADETLALKLNFANQLLYYPILSLTKISTLIFYRRISSNKTFRIWIYILLACNAGLTISITLADLFQCTPLPYVYDKTIRGRCINNGAFFVSTAAINILTDFAVVILPMPMLWGVQIHVKQKIALMGLFSLGTFVCVISIIRLQSIITTFVFTNPDPTYGIGFIWSLIEGALAIICASVPALKPFFMRHFPKLLGSSYFSSGRYGNSNQKNIYYGQGGPSEGYALGSVGGDRHAGQVYAGGHGPRGGDGHPHSTQHATVKAGVRRYNESEDSILAEAGITRTTDIRVDVEDVSIHSSDLEAGGVPATK